MAIDTLTIAEVRMFLRDYANATESGLSWVFNELIDEVEFSDAEVTLSMELAVSKYNVTGHISNEGVSGFPNKYILMLGTCSFLMNSEVFHQMRNQLNYQDGSEHHGYSDKSQSYMAIQNNLRNEWDAVVPLYKVSKNLEAAYGELSSAYAGFGYPTLVAVI